MAVRLGNNKWNSGDYFYSDDFNDTFLNIFGNVILQTARTSNPIDIERKELGLVWLTDFFTSSLGKYNTVNSTNTTATHSPQDQIYLPISFETPPTEDTTESNMSNPDNAFDSDSSTYAYARPGDPGSFYVGKIFSSPKYVESVYVYFYLNSSPGYAKNLIGFVEYYDGTNWISVYDTGYVDYLYTTKIVFINKTVQGIRFRAYYKDTEDAGIRVHSLFYTVKEPKEEIISINIPSGTYSSTIANAFFIPCFLKNNWDTHITVQYKMKNDTEDSGWLTPNKIESFPAFTSEPTELQIKISYDAEISEPVGLYGYTLTTF